MQERPPRESGLRYPREFLSIKDDFSDYSEFIKPYLKIKEEYRKMLSKRKFLKALPDKKEKALKAFKVTFIDIPDALYVSFAHDKDKAVQEACHYFKDNFHPCFMGQAGHHVMLQGRGIRVPDFDKYAYLGKVPIIELFSLDVTFPCKMCGEHSFTKEDLDNKKCYVIEGEGDLNKFTSGVIVCRECFNKYFK